MPIYEYKCKNCNKTFEVLQYFRDGALVPDEKEICKCDCKNSNLIKLISKSTFKLAGDCWAKDNYTKNKSP